MYLYILIIRNIYTFITKMDSINANSDNGNRENLETSQQDDDNDNGIKHSKNSNLINEEIYIQWINKRMYTRAGITAEETASIFCINRSKLSQYLKNELNTNFYEWIAMLRIEDAKKQLTEKPDKLISSIAIDVGIEDKSNFTRTFKKFTGFSPQIYRAQFLKQKLN